MEVVSKDETKKKARLDGLKLSQSNHNLLSFLIANDEDLDFFIKEFWEGVERQLFAITDFRSYKIKKINLSFSEFKTIFKDNNVEALELLFQQPVKQVYLDILQQRFDEGLKLFDLFLLHKNKPDYFLQTHIF